MAVSAVHVARVSNNLRAFNLLSTLTAAQLGTFRVQAQLATGLKFQTPSEDPLNAAAALRIDRRMDTLRGVEANLRTANTFLTEGEAAMQEAVQLAREAHDLALQSVGDSSSTDERQALSVVADSLIQRMVALGNRTVLGTYLFSGYWGDGPPFVQNAEDVSFRGDNGRLLTITDSDLSTDTFSISGRDFFNATSTAVQGFVDLTPRLTADTRVLDLRGATDRGIQLGPLTISDGTNSATIDLSSAATVGDILRLLNEGMPKTLKASIAGQGISITPAAGAPSITVTDSAGGQLAAALGFSTPTPRASLPGDDLQPTVTLRSRLADLRLGSGVALASGIVIRNGSQAFDLSFSGAQTVEDVLNTINQSGADVWARIAADGQTLEVVNRRSGSSLAIEENGGSSATELGIRSSHAGTLLSSLNGGRGVITQPGADFRITTRSGATVDVDVDALNLATATLQDVIDLINSTAGGAVTAALKSTGNGIAITDNTTGPGALTIERLNGSAAIDSLGLYVGATGNQLLGNDTGTARVDSIFTGLIELRDALQRDDRQGLSAAGERLYRTMNDMQTVHGELAAKAAAMQERADRVDVETTATRVMQSDIRDVDMSEAIVRFQQLQTALQANLATGSRLMGMSLIDYLR